MIRIGLAVLTVAVLASGSSAQDVSGVYASWTGLGSTSPKACSNPSVIVEPMRMRIDTMTCEWRQASVSGDALVFTGDCYDEGDLMPNTTIGALLGPDGSLGLTYAGGGGYIGSYQICPGSAFRSQLQPLDGETNDQASIPERPFSDDLANLDLPPAASGRIMETPRQATPQTAPQAEIPSAIGDMIRGKGPTQVQMLTVRNLRQMGMCPMDLPASGDLQLSNIHATASEEAMALQMAQDIGADCPRVTEFVEQSGVVEAIKAWGSVSFNGAQSLDQIMEGAQDDIEKYLGQQN